MTLARYSGLEKLELLWWACGRYVVVVAKCLFILRFGAMFRLPIATARANLRQLDLKAIISTNRYSWFRPPPDEMGLIILVTNIKTWR